MIRGQGLALQQLDRIEKAGLPPALLFVGPSGVGKRTIAIRFAADLAGVPYKRVENENSIDVRVYDGSTLNVQTAREIERQLHWAPTAAKKRVTIIDNAGSMSAPVYNTLLKILEEPPTTSHMILIGSSAGSIPLTVRSRCHVVSFVFLTEDEIFSILTEDLGMSDRSARSVSSISEGSMEKAMWGFKGFYREDLSLVSGIITSIRAGNLESALMEVDRWGDRTEVLRRLYFVYLYFRDCFILRRENLYALPTADLPLPAVTRICVKVQKAYDAINGNANMKIVLDNLVLDLASLTK